MGRRTWGNKPLVRFKRNSLSSPLQAPIEAELRTGQAAGLSNGVNGAMMECWNIGLHRNVFSDLKTLFQYSIVPFFLF
jgi:hypothetical protein